MSTYNGEQFLAEQIESIQKQTVKNWTLYIRDDGSSDTTPEIIKHYVRLDSRIVFINADNRENFGVIKNFYTLLKHSKADYYFFSDQDDIWYEGKVKKVLEELQKSDLCFSNFSIIDQDKNIMEKIHFKENPITKNWFYNFNKNVFFGCCMAFKKDCIKDFMPIPITIPSYDTWIGTVLYFRKKKISFIMEPLVFYRRHNSNVSQATCKSKNSIYFKIFWRIQFLVELIKYLKKYKG